MTEAGAMGTGDLTGRVALVTGSTSGIGLRVAEALARRGARVALNGRNAASADGALQRLASTGAEAIFEAGDVAVYDEIRRVVENVERRLAPIDILVSCGGSGRPGHGPFHEMKPEEFLKNFETRFLPRVFPVHAAIGGMRVRERGSIVLLATDAGRYPTPGESLQGAAGAATMLVTKALAREFSRWKVRVNCIALTLTSDTPRYDAIFKKQDFSNKLFSKALERFPFGRAPNAMEVAEVAAFLASDQSAQVSGQTISVNGALSFGGW